MLTIILMAKKKTETKIPHKHRWKKRMNVTTLTVAMAAYSNERVAAFIISVLYRMLTAYISTKLKKYHFF